jgi:hypothetical protein
MRELMRNAAARNVSTRTDSPACHKSRNAVQTSTLRTAGFTR